MAYEKGRNVLKLYKIWKLIYIFYFFSGTIMAEIIDDQTRILVNKRLAVELSVNENDINITSVKKMTWSDSALGCPEKGKYYLPVITSGYLVKARVKNNIYIIHTGNNQAVWCGQRATSNAKNKLKIRDENLSRQVKALQLSRELLLSENQHTSKKVSLISIKKESWIRAKNQCASKELSANSFSDNNDGYLIVLEKGKQQHTFFSNGKRVTHCNPKK